MEWYHYLIIGIAVICILIGIMCLAKKYKGFKAIVYKFVLEAESIIKGNKMGEYRFDYVMDKIYEYIPSALKPILTEKRLEALIEWAVAKMKKMLEK